MITIKNQAAVTRPLNHNLFLNLNHFLVVADGAGLNKKPTAVLQPWVLVKLYHSTSANGVANYNDDSQFNCL